MKLTGIIIQARSGSKRFPNKIFKLIGSKTVLEHVISRVNKVNFKKKIIIATSNKQQDDRVIKIALKNNCGFFRGAELNVLDRFSKSASKFGFKSVVRISGDSPFIDPNLINKGYKLFKKSKADLVSNIQIPSYPKGMSIEIMRLNTLKKLKKLNLTKDDKEHVTSAIYKNKKKFKIKNYSNIKNLRNYKFALDYPHEIKYLRKIYSRLVKKKIEKKFTLTDLINLSDRIY